MKSEFLRFKRLAERIKSDLQLLIDSVKLDISLLSGSTNDEINNLSARVTQIEGNPSAEFSGTLDNVPSGVTNKHLTSTLKTNYDAAYSHSQSTHAPSNAQKNSDITKEEIEAKLIGEISTHSHTGSSSPTAWGKYF